MAIAPVQTAPIGILTTVTSCAVTFGANVTAGNLIVVCVSQYRVVGVPPSITSITDTQGNTYQAVNELVWGEFAGAQLVIWRAFNINGGANVVTVTCAGTNDDITVVATELSGALTTDPNDGSNQNFGSDQTPTLSLTTVDSNPFIVGAFAHDGSTRSLTSGSGYAVLAENEAGSTSMPIHAEYRAFTSSGAKTVDGAIGTGTVGWAIVAASFKAAGGGGGGPATVDKPESNLVRPFNFARAAGRK